MQKYFFTPKMMQSNPFLCVNFTKKEFETILFRRHIGLSKACDRRIYLITVAHVILVLQVFLLPKQQLHSESLINFY